MQMLIAIIKKSKNNIEIIELNGFFCFEEKSKQLAKQKGMDDRSNTNLIDFSFSVKIWLKVGIWKV